MSCAPDLDQGSATRRCLLEPAILHSILHELQQQELLFAQMVCRTWYTTINSSKRLRAALFLNPSPSCGPHPPSYIVNPLLQKHFPYFFQQKTILNRYHSSAHHNLGPWICSRMLGTLMWTDEIEYCQQYVKGLPRSPHPAYMRPEASWRSMLPWQPAISALLVDFGDGYQGKLRSLKFSNDDRSIPPQGLERPWLTFGVLYDVIEAAWFRSDPLRVRSVLIDDSFCAHNLAHRELYSQAWFLLGGNGWSHADKARIHAQFPELGVDRPDCLYVRFEEQLEPESELRKKRRSMVRSRNKGTGRPHDTIYQQIHFTNEFQMSDFTTIKDIDWDTVREYGSAENPRRTELAERESRRLFGLPLFLPRFAS